MTDVHDSCTVCDARIDPYGRDGTRCDRCKQPCPVCHSDVSLCRHKLQPAGQVNGCVDGDVHHTIRKGGEFRCRDCSAQYVIDTRGARWVDVPRRKAA